MRLSAHRNSRHRNVQLPATGPKEPGCTPSRAHRTARPCLFGPRTPRWSQRKPGRLQARYNGRLAL
ncbi:MAG: hypothetical protein ACI8PT_001255 [Gammaproteobacteria bacterium]|jgi:hypothetical protein